MQWLAALLLACICFAPALGQYDPNCSGKQVIVHLFEWRWQDVAAECERFLGPKGFCGVQISPPNENAVITSDAQRPWWERYQPVSYKLVTRSGSESDFIDMVERCNAVGVRIYADTLINHMAAVGRSGTGTAGTSFNADNRDFPGVPYSFSHFTARERCPSGDGGVNAYEDPNNVRNCNLIGLTDLDQSQEYVRDKIKGYLNRLIEIGVAGFRIDAAKHMWPGDLGAIFSGLNNLNSRWFGSGARAFVCLEVIDRNDGAVTTHEYVNLGLVTEFRYSQKLGWASNDFNQFNSVVDYGWHMTQADRAFVFVDNHDNQRGHGGRGDVATHKDPRKYKMTTAFMLAYPYGFTRVMSSYTFSHGSDGPPHNGDYSIKDVPINGDGSCGNGWICEHRWRPISNMAAFRTHVAGTDIQHWHNNGNEVAFARGNKGFFAMVKGGSMDAWLNTGLPAGDYCDLISACATRISVGSDGRANIRISNNDEPIIAIITGDLSAVTGSTGSAGPTRPTVSAPPVDPTPANVAADITSGQHRTVIFVQKQTVVGQDLFIRGGVDHNRRQGCTYDVSTSACAISITHRSSGTGNYHAKFAAWATGDTTLDWYGAETGQGSYQGSPPDGTPALWTSNTGSDASHNSMNSFGPHYWMVDVDMDCGDTDNGWFELKAVVNGVWESDINARQGQACGGTAGGVIPYASANHVARCGYINVFSFSTNRCTINTF